MKNITVTVSDKAYREARVWAAQRDTSLSRVVQYLISTLPNIARVQNSFPVAKPSSSNSEIRPLTTPGPDKIAN